MSAQVASSVISGALTACGHLSLLATAVFKLSSGAAGTEVIAAFVAAGVALKNAHDCYIANGEACTAVLSHVAALQRELRSIREREKQGGSTAHLRPHLARLEEALTDTDRMVRANILPPDLSPLQRSVWIARQVLNGPRLSLRLAQRRQLIAETMAALTLGTATVTAQHTQRLLVEQEQSGQDFQELRLWVTKQHKKQQLSDAATQRMLEQVLAVLEGRKEAAVVADQLNSQPAEQQRDHSEERLALRSVYEQQDRVLAAGLRQGEEQLKRAGEWDGHFAQLMAASAALEEQLKEHTADVLAAVQRMEANESEEHKSTRRLVERLSAQMQQFMSGASPPSSSSSSLSTSPLSSQPSSPRSSAARDRYSYGTFTSEELTARMPRSGPRCEATAGPARAVPERELHPGRRLRGAGQGSSESHANPAPHPE